MVMPSSKKKKKRSCLRVLIFTLFLITKWLVGELMGNVRDKYSFCHISVIFILFYYNVFRKVPLRLYYYNKILQHFLQ